MTILPTRRQFIRLLAFSSGGALLAACTSAPPAAPAPTAAPAAKAEAPKQVAPAASPAAAAKPAESPAAAKPAASPVAAPAAAASPAAKPSYNEQAVADFYRGKTVRIIVGTSAGGGFDILARLIAKHFPKHVPGNPTVIVENMPGAATTIAANHLARVAPKDGTVIANIGGASTFQQLFGTTGIEYDLRQMHFLGVPTPSTYVLAVRKELGVSRIGELLGSGSREAVLGTTGPGSGSHDVAAMTKEVLGANFKLVPGYAGLAQVKLVMASGEVDAFFTPWETTKVADQDKVDSGDWKIILQAAEQPHADLANVPTIVSLAKDDEQRQLLSSGAVTPNLFEKMYVVAPEVPAERVAALQDAFLKALADRDLLADAANTKQEISPVPGPEVHRRVSALLSVSPDLKARLERILKA